MPGSRRGRRTVGGVAFQGYRDGIWHIYVMNDDGSGLRMYLGSVRRSRTLVVARRQPHRVFVGSLGQLRHLGARSRERRSAPDDAQPRERLRAGRGRRPIRRSPSSPSAKIAAACGRIDASTGAETLVAPLPVRVNAPSWSADGSKVIYNVIAANQSQLIFDGRAVTAQEDVFPFRAQWASPIGGDLHRRRQDQEALDPGRHGHAHRIHRDGLLHAQRLHAASRATSTRAPPAPVRGIMAPVLSPDGTQVAFAALGDLWVMPIGGAARTLDQRSLRRDGSDLVTGRPLARVLF